jgi:pimeloyl-ACP methyl ester carboxylesterase
VRDLIVVIPGITGSILRRDDRDVWNLSLTAVGRGLASFSAAVEALRLPRDVGPGPAPASAALDVGGLITGWHLWPGIHGGPGYRRLLDVLASVGGAGGRAAVRSFGYDWRLSNRHSARLLAASVEGWLRDWRARTGDRDAKVIFVAHSMGGLVARYYLEVLGGREHARRLITLGTPYRGSVNAIRALTGDAFQDVPLLGGQSGLTEAARSFPALWELLPTYRCVGAEDGPVDLSTAAPTDLPAAAVARGLAFHQEIAAAVARNSAPPYQLHAFAGKRQATWQSLALDPGQRRYLREQRGQDHRGDGTVPLFSAVPPEWANTEMATSLAARHGGLCSDAAVLDLILDKIEPLDLGDVLAPPCELGLDLPEVAGASAPLRVRVESDREDLLLHACLRDPATGENAAAARMIPDGDGGYHVSLAAGPGTWLVVVEAVAERPVVRVEDLVTVVPG